MVYIIYMINKQKKMTGVNLTASEREIVQSESEKRGLYNFSATLRMIIQEWAKFTRVIPDNDKSGRQDE